MEITYLADYPEHADRLALWQHQQWSHVSPERTLKSRVREFRETMNREAVPMTVIAVEDDKVLGAASLTIDEMDTRTEWNPWLANVYVEEGHRHRGIARELLERIIEEAETLGFEEIYLFAYTRFKLYEELGWTTISQEMYRGRETHVMRRELDRS